MKPFTLALAAAIVAVVCSTASAGWTYVVPPPPVAHGTVVYHFSPAPPVYTYPPRVAVYSWPVVRVSPLPAPATVVYPGRAVVRTKVYHGGRRVRTTVRGVWP